MKKLFFIFMAVLFVGCNPDSDTDESPPINLSGNLNQEPVSITSGFCEISKSNDLVMVTAGTNRAFTKGVLLFFSSLDVAKQQVYTLPSSVLTAGYSANITATGGTVDITSLTKSDTTIQSIAGSFRLSFSGDNTGSLTGTFNCPAGS